MRKPRHERKARPGRCGLVEPRRDAQLRAHGIADSGERPGGSALLGRTRPVAAERDGADVPADEPVSLPTLGGARLKLVPSVAEALDMARVSAIGSTVSALTDPAGVDLDSDATTAGPARTIRRRPSPI